MRPYRSLLRGSLAVTKQTRCYKPITIRSRNMSLFPRSIHAEPGFAPLFRLLEDFDSYQTGQGRQRGHLPHFQPKFDVRETDASYELHGELPGMNKNDVHIEFSDPQTMLIRGRIERSYTSDKPPVLIESAQTGGAITESGEKSPHQATVEDENAGGNDTSASSGEVTNKAPKDKTKYWVSERSVGEFARSFNFPTLVDQDSVSASLQDGILSVVVPKQKKRENRRITIN